MASAQRNNGDSIRQPEIIETSALTSITKGEVDIQVATAKRYPRDMARFLKTAEGMACIDAETAASCHYALPRDGKRITGPSVRLAEIVAASWGNLRCEARIIEVGGAFITAQGTAWDIENNVLIRMETQRKITDRNGRRFSDDMVVTTGNAAAAIAFRNALFKVVPTAMTRTLQEKIKKVAVGDEKTLAVRRAHALEWFKSKGVSVERVLAVLERDGVESINLDDLFTLTGLKTAIVEGTTTIEEAFPTAAAPVKEPVEGAHKVKTSERQAADETVDPKTGEVTAKPTQDAAEKPKQEPAKAPPKTDASGQAKLDGAGF